MCSRYSQELEGKLIDYNNQLEQAANTDALTGLYNRRKTMEYLEELNKKAGSKEGFSICICDIDFFKKVNDNYGHDFGDEVLKSISQIFKDEMKGKNLAARWGGEEFLLIFPGSNGDEAYIKLKQIRERIKQMRVVKGDLSVGVTMTFGLSEYDYFNGLEATLKDADNKLYMGKEGGRDVIIF
jgi:diguanylate cyclase (GGDEF)-like protein